MPTYIVRHHGGWKYKRAVPADLHDMIGRKSWVAYLGASLSRRDAEALGRQHAGQHDKIIAGLRALSEAERTAIVGAGGLDAYRQQVEGEEIGEIFVAAAGDFVVDPGASDAAESAVAVLDAQQTAARMRAAVAKGRGTLAKVTAQRATVAALVPVWQRVARPRSPGTITRMTTYANRFAEIIGDVALQDVTRKHVMKFRDALEKVEGLAPVTQSKHLHAVRRLFNVALSEGLVDANPAQGIFVRKVAGEYDDAEGGKDFTAEEVRTLFAALENKSKDFQWTVRLLAFHGARSGEICQLHVDDITTLHGFPVIRIHGRHGSLKNRHSRRDVPLHPACAAIVDYAASVPGPWLFASWPLRKAGRAGKFTDDGNTWVRETLPDTDVRIRGFRHGWRTMARELSMPTAVSRAIMGHKLGRDVHDEYGGPPPMKMLADWMAKVDPLA